jgi:hypothetical protein
MSLTENQLPIIFEKLTPTTESRYGMNVPNYRKLRLTNGNCCIFAESLRELLGKGELWHFGENDNTNKAYYDHFLLSLDGGKHLIDGTGIHSKEEAERFANSKMYNEWDSNMEIRAKVKPTSPEYTSLEAMRKNTCNNMDYPKMKELILNLADPNSSFKDALELYEKKHDGW